MKLTIRRAKRIRTGTPAVLSIEIPGKYQATYAAIVKKNQNDYFDIEFSNPRKPRTTGPDSQNHKFNGIVQQIAEDTGNDFNDVKLYIKRRAFRRGLPYKTRPDDSIVYSLADGEPLPISESDMSTIECSWCIEEAIILAGELGIILKED